MIKTKNLKIGIDARFLGQKQKGLGRYVQKLVENLEQVDFDNQYVIFLRKENWLDYNPCNPNFKKVLADYGWYGLKEQVLMPLKIYKEKIDLMHFPHFNLPVLYFRPFVVTIHDLVLRRFPTRRASTLGPILYRFKNLAYRFVIYSAVKRSKKIIAVSNYTKNDILRYYKVKPEKIQVVYEGSPVIGNMSEKMSRHDLDIPKPFLLYVGNAYPHKNLERLIIAFKRLIEQEKMDLRLVLVGGTDYFYNQLKKKSCVISSGKIIFMDFLFDDELNILYKNASAYVFPSLCEGFGLPSLEAMVHNLPVVCSNSTCLPEILGYQAALYFNPNSIDDMVEKIKNVLSDKKLRQKLAYSGQQRIKKYSWLRMAEQTLGVYKFVR
ncbi:MAG: glycosyltransferase family 1 protein [bacterium]